MSDPAPTIRRRSIRLSNYDYTQAGGYFVTICTHGRQSLFGQVIDEQMRLNAFGEIAARAWLEAISIRAELTLDEFVIMPNHVHGIVLITERPSDFPNDQRQDARGPERITSPERTPVRHYATHQRAGDMSATKRPLGRFVAAYKGAVTTAINTQRGTPGMPIWQQNYYEHIIRNEADMTRIWAYIATNLARWSTDPENIACIAPT